MRRRRRREKPKAAPAPRIGSGPGTMVVEMGVPEVNSTLKELIVPGPVVPKTDVTLVLISGVVNKSESIMPFIETNDPPFKPSIPEVMVAVPEPMGGTFPTVPFEEACTKGLPPSFITLYIKVAPAGNDLAGFNETSIERTGLGPPLLVTFKKSLKKRDGPFHPEVGVIVKLSTLKVPSL